jgi:hypothetical protein
MHLAFAFSAVLCMGALGCTIDTGTDSGWDDTRPQSTGPYGPEDVDGGNEGSVDAGRWLDPDGGDRPSYVDAGAWPDVDGGSAPPVLDAGPWSGEDAGDRPPYVDAGTGPGPDAGWWPGEDAGAGDALDGGTASECASVTDEAVCTVTPECEAVYVGVDCVCYPDGTCRCESWEFSMCE